MEFRASVLLSLQGALWDLVGPNLRGVTATFDYPVVTARFLFENDPTEEDRERLDLDAAWIVRENENKARLRRLLDPPDVPSR